MTSTDTLDLEPFDDFDHRSHMRRALELAGEARGLGETNRCP